MRSTSRLLRSTALSMALCVATAPLDEAFSLDGRKAAEEMYKQGQLAYQAGDFDAAARLYLQAWRTDPATPIYAYSAGRADHVAGRLELAREHYRAFVASPDAPAEYVEKARSYMAQIQLDEAVARAAEADRLAIAGRHTTAAAAYLEAWAAAPERLGWLVRASEMEEAAGSMSAAREHLAEFLRRAPSDAPEVPAARARLERLEAPPVVIAPSPAPKSDPPLVEQWWLWTVVGVVVAGGVTAAVLLTRDPGTAAPDAPDAVWRFGEAP